jgi:hypothetical protein
VIPHAQLRVSQRIPLNEEDGGVIVMFIGTVPFAGIVSGTWTAESWNPDVFVWTALIVQALLLKFGIPNSMGCAWLVEELNPSNPIGFELSPQTLSGAEMLIPWTWIGGGGGISRNATTASTTMITTTIATIMSSRERRRGGGEEGMG